MSDRDVRELAEEIAINCYPVKGSTQEKLIDFAEEKIRALLVGREANLKEKLRAAAGDVVKIFLDARPPGTVDLVYDKLARRLGLEDPDGS